MDDHTANSTFAHPDFVEMMKDRENTLCFDCGKTPASWASVSNSIYLCLNCASEHRSYGLSVSYVRSIAIDTWNDTQMRFMKVGGNKRLEELLKLYEVQKGLISPKELYFTKLLEYHRNQIKSDVTQGKQLIPPKIDEALQFIEGIKGNVDMSSQAKNNEFNSGNINLNSNPNNQEQPNSNSFFSSVNSIFSSAYEKGKNVATNVTEKVKDMEITHKIMSTGTNAVEVIKEKGSNWKEKGNNLMQKGMEKGNEIVHFETVQNFKHKMEDGVNYVYGKVFGKTNQEEVHAENNVNAHGNFVNVNANTNPYDVNPDTNEIIDNQFTSTPDIDTDIKTKKD